MVGVITCSTSAPSEGTETSSSAITYRPRIINTTDLGADPDDKQSMVRQLVCANEFDIEGLIVSAGCWRKTQKNIVMLDKILEGYGKVVGNLSVHAEGFPSLESLKSVSVMGQKGYGMGDVGTGKDSPGSELIIASVDKDDPRPVWVMGWGGMNTAAQAIWKVRETRSKAEFNEFRSKLRLFDILGQDDAGAWIAKKFPDIFYIRATGVYGWAPSDSYLDKHIQNHGPLGALYPDRKWATEGDTPAFMHVYPNGLNTPDGDSLSYSWSFYKEPSSYYGPVTIQESSSPTATVTIPSDAGGKTLHIILEIHDDGSPNLNAYRRMILNAK